MANDKGRPPQPPEPPHDGDPASGGGFGDGDSYAPFDKLVKLATPLIEGFLLDAIEARDRRKVDEQLRMDQPAHTPMPLGPFGGGAIMKLFSRPVFSFHTPDGEVIVMDDGTTCIYTIEVVEPFVIAAKAVPGATLPNSLAEAAKLLRETEIKVPDIIHPAADGLGGVDHEREGDQEKYRDV